jgi:hypothetical protein
VRTILASSLNVQVEDRPLACLDDSGNADVSVSFRSSFDCVRSNWQSYDLGNFIVARNVIFHVLEDLSAGRVDRVGTVRVVWQATIVEFVGGCIDL